MRRCERGITITCNFYFSAFSAALCGAKLSIPKCPASCEKRGDTGGVPYSMHDRIDTVFLLMMSKAGIPRDQFSSQHPRDISARNRHARLVTDILARMSRGCYEENWNSRGIPAQIRKQMNISNHEINLFLYLAKPRDFFR